MGIARLASCNDEVRGAKREDPKPLRAFSWARMRLWLRQIRIRSSSDDSWHCRDASEKLNALLESCQLKQPSAALKLPMRLCSRLPDRSIHRTDKEPGKADRAGYRRRTPRQCGMTRRLGRSSEIRLPAA